MDGGSHLFVFFSAIKHFKQTISVPSDSTIKRASENAQIYETDGLHLSYLYTVNDVTRFRTEKSSITLFPYGCLSLFNRYRTTFMHVITSAVNVY